MDSFSADDSVFGYGERDHSGDTDQVKAPAPQPAREVEFGSGWYHDIAIVEAEQAKPRLPQAGR